MILSNMSRLWLKETRLPYCCLNYFRIILDSCGRRQGSGDQKGHFTPKSPHLYVFKKLKFLKQYFQFRGDQVTR